MALADGPYRILSTGNAGNLQVRVLRPLVLRPRSVSVPLIPDEAEESRESFEYDLGQFGHK